MKISVITVCFNSAGTIADALRSVAAQTHPDIEHIVVDGASRDDTLRVISAHSASVSKLVSEPDAGIYDAMNKGIALATGDYVGFLNADDMLASPSALAALAAAASDAGGADAVYGDLSYVGQDRTDRVIRHWKSGAFRRSRLGFGWMPPHPTFYVKRSTLENFGGFDLRFKIAADYDFMLRCLSRPGVCVAYVPEVIVRMRMGGASNRSLKALLQKSREDLTALRNNRIGGAATLFCKNARKLPQFVRRAPRDMAKA